MELGRRRQGNRFEREAEELGRTLEKMLSSYAAAAVAAGVGVLAVAAPMEGKVVYTPAQTVIPPNSTLVLDLNHDGTPDFLFKNLTSSILQLSVGCATHSTSRGYACDNQKNEIWGRGIVFRRFASALDRGVTVGPNKNMFQQPNPRVDGWPGATMAHFAASSSTSATYGQWLYTRNRFVGLQFVIEGKAHYGWARVSVNLIHPKAASARRLGITAVLTGYAYETEPNKPIVTGETSGPDVVVLEPGSLGVLSQGVSTVPYMPKRR